MWPLDLSFLVESVLIFALAFLIDVVFGEIPDRVHPTVWMGKVIAYLKPKVEEPKSEVGESERRVALRWRDCALCGSHVFLLLWAARQIPGWGWLVYVVVAAVLLKTTFAVKCMSQYTVPIAKALENGLTEATTLAALHCETRPKLSDERHMISAAVESIAESTTDGAYLAPLLFRPVWGSRRLCFPGHQHVGFDGGVPG